MQYFLIYRCTKRFPLVFDLDWDNPTGGIVSNGVDRAVVEDVAYQRYHCGPNEKLVMFEVVDDKRGQYQATVLHLAWEIDCMEFCQWMQEEPA